MNLVFHPQSHAQGVVTLPADKSILHRALILAALSDSPTSLIAAHPGEDVLSTVSVLEQLGVDISYAEGIFTVKGRGLKGLQAPSHPLYCGNSGTTMRLMAGVLSAQAFPSVLTGDPSLSRRPMDRIVTPLKLMGADIQSTEGRAPLQIKPVNALTSLHYRLPVASAQVKSCLMYAGLCAGVQVTFEETRLTRDHTQRIFNYWPSRSLQEPLQIPGDFSAAAYFIVAATLAKQGRVKIPAVGVNPSRSALLKYLILMGARISMDNHRWFGHEPVADLEITPPKKLFPVRVHAQDIPTLIDELPILFVCAAAADGTSIFPELGELRHKESDRLQLMIAALEGLGVSVTLENETLTVRGQAQFNSLCYPSHRDHRIIMALAMACFRSRGPITLTDAEHYRISFPPFLDACRAIGLRLTKKDSEHA